jgi:hypothetical protein
LAHFVQCLVRFELLLFTEDSGSAAAQPLELAEGCTD